MNALGYLVTRSFVNGVLLRLRRLRQPRYLIGAALGFAYFYFYFGRFVFGQHSPFGVRPTSATAFSVEVGAAILFIVTLVLSWILPASRAAIGFSEAEIAFLFPANRWSAFQLGPGLIRSIIHIDKIIKEQPEVSNFSRRLGTQMGFFITEPNRGDFLIQLKKQRNKTTDEVSAELRAKIEGTLPQAISTLSSIASLSFTSCGAPACRTECCDCSGR